MSGKNHHSTLPKVKKIFRFSGMSEIHFRVLIWKSIHEKILFQLNFLVLGPTYIEAFLYFCLFKKLEFLTSYEISLIEISQCRSNLLTHRNDNIKPNIM